MSAVKFISQIIAHRALLLLFAAQFHGAEIDYSIIHAALIGRVYGRRIALPFFYLRGGFLMKQKTVIRCCLAQKI